jgi:hypothetical protein
MQTHQLKMKIIILLSTLLLSFVVGHSQTTFQKTYGIGSSVEEGWDFVQTSDSGYAIIGLNDVGIYLLKTNSNGDTLWNKTYPGTPGYMWATSVRQTTDGGYIIAGSVYTTAYQILLIKTNSTGDITWSKQFGGTYDDMGGSVIQTSDGGYIFVGSTSLNGVFNYDVFVVKVNSDGTLAWSKTYGDTNTNYGGCIEQTTDGGYIIAGSSKISVGPNDDIILLKINSAGILTWVKKYGETGKDAQSYVRETSDGGYVIVGNTTSFSSSETFLLKTNSSGTLQWTKTYAGIDGNMVYEFNSSNYIVTGTSSNGAFLMKTNNVGDTVWSKNYNPPMSITWSSSVKPTNDGGFAFCGSIGIAGDTSSIYLVKTDSSGGGVCYSSVPNYNVTAVTFTTTDPTYLTSSLNTTSDYTLQTVGYPINVSSPCITGINELTIKSSLTIFPNPFSIQTTLQTDKALKDATLTLYNALGQQARQVNNISGLTLTLHRDNLTSGLYYLQLTQDHQTIATDKLVITD